MAQNTPDEIVVCAKTGSVLWAKDAYYLDGIPYRPEAAPKGAVPFGGAAREPEPGPIPEPVVPAQEPSKPFEVKGK